MSCVKQHGIESKSIDYVGTSVGDGSHVSRGGVVGLALHRVVGIERRDGKRGVCSCGRGFKRTIDVTKSPFVCCLAVGSLTLESIDSDADEFKQLTFLLDLPMLQTLEWRLER